MARMNGTQIATMFHQQYLADRFGTRRKLPHFQCEEIGGFLGRL